MVALNVCSVFPAVMAMLAGTVMSGELEMSATEVLVSAGWDNVAVHRLVAPDMTPVGLHVIEATVTGEAREIVADCEDPLYAAITEPLWFAANTPACRVNTPELDPAAIASDDGADRMLFTTDRTMLTPPAGAFLLRVTVQLLEDDGPSVAGTQTSEDTNTGATRPMLVFAVLPLYAAVMVAF
jgi:hypothetical protein